MTLRDELRQLLLIRFGGIVPEGAVIEIESLIASSVADERERCAMVCEERAEKHRRIVEQFEADGRDPILKLREMHEADACAAAIRKGPSDAK
jgi:hypothetical protein